MTSKYAVIPIELYDELEVRGIYRIINVRELYVLLEYTDEPNPTGENWVIFSGDGANLRCAEYLRNEFV